MHYYDMHVKLTTIGFLSPPELTSPSTGVHPFSVIPGFHQYGCLQMEAT
jgi:hypothetical protein